MNRRWIFWDFPRASWPYDVVVGLILIFIFATPRDFFRDQPKAAPIIIMGPNQFFIANELLERVAPVQRPSVASNLIRQRIGKNLRVNRIQPLRDDTEQELRGFIAYTSQPN